MGTNTINYNMHSESFNLSVVNGTLTITESFNGWSHSLINVERVQFSDKSLAFDSDGRVGEAA